MIRKCEPTGSKTELISNELVLIRLFKFCLNIYYFGQKYHFDDMLLTVLHNWWVLCYVTWDFFGRNNAKAETPVLWPPHAKSWLTGKDSDAGKITRVWVQEEKGTTEDEMAGWHHWLNGRESGWTPGVGDGQGGLVCCAIHGVTVGHYWATELNWLNWCYVTMKKKF